MAKKLGIPDMCYLADVTPMTIYNWRGEPARKTRALPVDVDSRGRVTIAASRFRAWAKENDIPLKADPVAYMEAGGLAAHKKKPGPKPRVEAEERAKKERARDLERINSKRKPTASMTIGEASKKGVLKARTLTFVSGLKRSTNKPRAAV